MPQHMVVNGGWQLGNSSAPNVAWPQMVPNNEGRMSNCNNDGHPNNTDPEYPMMCHNGGICPSGNPCRNAPATMAVPTGRNQGPMNHEDSRAEDYVEPAQQLESPEDEHIRSILEHARMHRDGIMQRQIGSNDANR